MRSDSTQCTNERANLRAVPQRADHALSPARACRHLVAVLTFPETNVRTYVVDRSGLDGLWFLSLDAAGLATVLGSRPAWGFPRHWAAMTVEVGSRLTYQSRRRWPPAAGHDIVAEPRSPLAAEELGERDHFLTGRWRAFTGIAGRLVNVPVKHQAWPAVERADPPSRRGPRRCQSAGP